MTNQIKPTMKLITSAWQSKKAFKLMPISNDCPYKEAIFDVDSKILVFIAKDLKTTFHMLPRLDDNGDPIRTKGARENGKTYKEERKSIDTASEHYVSEISEITEAIKEHAINADTFDWQSFLIIEDKKIIVPKKELILP